ncbi:MAG: ChrR family anti-sigma-E factor [Pseudomonadota bacterium]
MTIRHHLSDPLLMAYAAGQLPEAFSLVVATHLSMCDDCRAQAATFDAVGGALIDRAEPAVMDAGSLDAVLARLDTPASPPVRPPVRPRVRAAGLLPTPLADYVGGDLDRVKWRSIGMGVKQAILPTDRAASARLLYIPAGRAVPDHGHRGLELTLVLQGAFSDSSDRFGRGDVEIADQDMQHTPVAETGMDCICLAATDAPLRFTDMLPRLVQPLFRI